MEAVPGVAAVAPAQVGRIRVSGTVACRRPVGAIATWIAPCMGIVARMHAVHAVLA